MLLGHNRGADTLEDICSYIFEFRVRCQTVFAFSIQNRSWPRSEMDRLMLLMRHFLQLDTAALLKNNFKFSVTGRCDKLGDNLVVLIRELRPSIH